MSRWSVRRGKARGRRGSTPGGDGGGGCRAVGHGIVGGTRFAQGGVRQGFHLEAEVRTACEEARGSQVRGGEIVGDDEDDGEGLLHHPLAVNDDAEPGEDEQAGEEDDFVADARRHAWKQSGNAGGRKC